MSECIGFVPVMHMHSINDPVTNLPNSRELITSEIVYWLYQVLTGKHAEFLSWPAAASFHTQRKQMRPGVGTLQDWVQDLLKKVVFKVSQHLSCILLYILSEGQLNTKHHAACGGIR